MGPAILAYAIGRPHSFLSLEDSTRTIIFDSSIMRGSTYAFSEDLFNRVMTFPSLADRLVRRFPS